MLETKVPTVAEILAPPPWAIVGDVSHCMFQFLHNARDIQHSIKKKREFHVFLKSKDDDFTEEELAAIRKAGYSIKFFPDWTLYDVTF